MKNVAVAAGMAWLLIAVAFVPVAAPAGRQAMTAERNTSTVSCTIFTLDGIDVVEKTVERRAVEDIASVMDAGAGVAEVLANYGLLGKRSVAEVTGLIHGDWQKNMRNRMDGERNIYFNALCSVNATGHLVMIPMAFLTTMWLLQHFFLTLKVHDLLPVWLEHLFNQMLELAYPPVISLCEAYSNLSKKPPLFRGYLTGNNMTIKTTGLFGYKEKDSGMYRMRGFTGIWITDRETNDSWLRGYALSVVQAA